MKAKYLMLFLISVLIFNSVGCISSEPETIKVQYIATACTDRTWIYPTITVSWNNDQRDTETIDNLILKRRLSEVFQDVRDPKFSAFLDDEEWKAWHGEVIATYNHIPKNEPLAIAAMGKNRADAVSVFIIVDGYLWKSELCEGEGCGADASGLYDK